MERETELYFPMFVSLKRKMVVVVGGGVVAARRVETLLVFGCKIVIIAPKLKKGMQELLEKSQKKTLALDKKQCFSEEQWDVDRIIWKKRNYQRGDCKGAFLAVAATDCREVNQMIGQECEAEGIFVTVADRKEESSFYFPAIVQKGAVVAGITASGTDHKLTAKVAKQVRDCFQQIEV